MSLLYQSGDLDDELIFQISSNVSAQEHTMNRQGVMIRDLMYTNTTLRGRPLAMIGDQGRNNDDDKKKKVTMHRETERQRRQEMAKLYASLRSFLPLELIKGNRSVSDHIHQAVNYLKLMQESIKELIIKRDKLKRMSDTSVLPGHRKSIIGSSINWIPNTVVVSSCQGGVEILINGGVDFQQSVALSTVFVALLEEGLSVVRCMSTKVKGRSLHNLHCEVSNQAFTNLSLLQQKMTDVINTRSDFN